MRGYTLIELVSALAVVGILIGYAVPTMSNIYSRSEATTRVNWVIGAVNFTRHAAISQKTMATLCPMEKVGTTIRCGKKWSGNLMVFADKDQNGKFGGKDKLIETIRALTPHGTIKWRSFRNRQYLQITAHGYTNFQNGNFTYCSPDQDPTLSRQIVVNVQARARVIHAKDDQGVRLDRKGKILRC